MPEDSLRSHRDDPGARAGQRHSGGRSSDTCEKGATGAEVPAASRRAVPGWMRTSDQEGFGDAARRRRETVSHPATTFRHLLAKWPAVVLPERRPQRSGSHQAKNDGMQPRIGIFICLRSATLSTFHPARGRCLMHRCAHQPGNE